MSASLTIQGDKALERKLTKFAPKIGRKIVKKALRAGAKIVRTATKARVRSRSGITKRAIITRAGKRSRNHQGVTALLQIFNTRKYPQLIATSKAGKRAFKPAALEYGHAAPGNAGGVKVVAAKSFVRSGFQASKDQAAAKVLADLKTGIEAEWRKPA